MIVSVVWVLNIQNPFRTLCSERSFGFFLYGVLWLFCTSSKQWSASQTIKKVTLPLLKVCTSNHRSGESGRGLKYLLVEGAS